MNLHRTPWFAYLYAGKYVVGFALGWAAVFFRRWNKRRLEGTAQNWPSVEARIHSGTVAPIPKTTRFLATLQYSYFLDEYRSGKYTHEFKQESDADEFVRQLKDKRVQIRYKAANPNQSVLEERTLEQHVMLATRLA